MPGRGGPCGGILLFYGTIRRKRLPAGSAAQEETVKVLFGGRSRLRPPWSVVMRTDAPACRWMIAIGTGNGFIEGAFFSNRQYNNIYI